MKNFGKRLLSFSMALFMVLSLVPFNGLEVYAAGSDAVAKVGNTEYATIDEAIAGWTNGTTLTLLADVTLSDVVTLNSTEHHILNLGTYTMTAASGKNAFVIKACGTGSAEKSAITIRADATNPGGINAGSKCVVYYKYADGGISTEDRPIIKIEGGVFTGATSSFGTAGIYTIGTAARKCATLNISGGTFNCSINGSSKSKLLISGGTFNYSVGSQGDSTALRLISGGKFKTLGFMTADSNNTKFWFGTSMGNSNVGLFVDADGYLNVGGPVIKEVSPQYPAVAYNATKWSSYLAYSAAATYGLFYKDADKAIAKHGEANIEVFKVVSVGENVTGSVADELVNNAAVNNFVVALPDEVVKVDIVVTEVAEEEITFTVSPMNANGEKVSEPSEAITFRLPIPAEWTFKKVNVYHDGTLLGKYEVQTKNDAKYVEITSQAFSEYAVEPVAPAATIGTEEYDTLQDAIDAVQNGETIVLHKACEETVAINKSSVAFTIDGNGNTYTGSIQINVDQNVTIKNVDFVWTDDAKCDFIANVGSPTGKNYNTTLLVEDCSFTGNGKDNVVAVRTIHPTVVTVKNSTGTGLHSFLQNTGGQKVAIDGVTLTESKGGLAVGTTADVTVVNCNLTTRTYGIRLDAVQNAAVTLTDNTVNAYIPVSVRKATAENYQLTIDGESSSYTATNADGKWCAICTTEYEEGVALNEPTGDVHVTLSENLDKAGVYGAYKAPVASVDGVEYADLISALKAIKANSVVEILSDVTINEKWDVRNTGAKITVPVTINGNGHTIAFNGVVNDGYNYYSAFRFEAAATVTDLTIDMTNAKSEFQGRFRAISAKSDLTVDGCTFIGNGSANNTRAVIFGEGAGDAIGNVVITITDSTFTGWRQGVSDNEQGKAEVKSVTITGNTFTDAGINVSAAETINFNNNTVDGRWVKLVSYVSENLTVNAQGNTLTANGDDINFAKGAVLNVQEEFLPSVAEVNGVQYKSLQAAFVAAGEKGNVTLLANVDLKNEEWTPIAKYSGTFDGNGYTIKNLKITHPGDQTVVNNVGLIGTLENGTIKNLTIENVNITGSGKVGAVAGNGYTGKIENVTVKGNIQIAGYQYVGGITGYGYASIDNCHVIGDGAATSVIKKVAKSEIYGSGTNGYVGGIKGFSGEGNIKVINSSVSNITITTNDDTVGGISGIFHYGNTFTGNKLTNVVITAPDNDGYNGIIAGHIQTIAGQTNAYEVTVENVTATADGVALPTLGNGATVVADTSAGNVLSGTVYHKSAAVAQIGDTYYVDLHEAMIACKSGETVLLIADVDLAGTEWEPVSFKGTFNGQNHTISNLTINKPGVSNTGFITSLNGTFKNVTFTNPTVTGGENTGVVAGRAGGGAALAENITVNGTIKVETTHKGYARAAVIVGGWAYGNYKNITVDGGDKAVSYVKHTGGGDGRYVGGIVGHADDVESYVNCTVKNITISGGWLCGAIAGPGPSDGLASGCVVENVNMNADYSGGMFGWYFGNGTIENSTIKDVAFTAGTTKNGAIGGYGANPSANVVNVTIENVTNQGKALLEHAAEIDGTYYFDLQAALDAVQEGETVKLLRDVELAKGITVNESFGFTLDGNGYSITAAEGANLGYQAVYFLGNADGTYTIKDLTFKDFVQSDATAVILRLESAGKFELSNVTFDNCDMAKGTGTQYAMMRVYNTDMTATGLTMTGCKGGILMDIGPSSDEYVGKIEIKDSTFENNTVLGTALIYPNLVQADNSFLLVSGTTFKNNVIGDATAAAPQGRGVIHLAADAVIENCTFDGNTVYGSHANNISYGVNEYSGYVTQITGNTFKNSAVYQTNANVGPVAGLAVMAVGEATLENNTVENNNKFYHRAAADAEYEEKAVRSVGTYSEGYGKTTILSGTYNGELVSYAGTGMAVSGGIFNAPVAEEFCETGYIPVDNGDGTYGVADDPKTEHITNLDELKAFRDSVNAGNTYKGITVYLAADIDLGSEEWTPIGNSTNKFQGIFDGQNHTISNLVVNGGSGSNQGFFGFTTDGEIKNLTIENAKVSGRLNVGVVAGTPYTSKYTNIKVTGHVEVNGLAYVGGVGGKNAYANWTDITVDVDETSYVQAISTENGNNYRTYVGGVVGFNGEGGHTFKNITSNIDVIGNVCDIGGIFGIVHYGNKVENVSCSGDVKSTGEAEEIGGIAGVWNNEKGYVVTMDDVTFTGTVSDVNGAVENVAIVGGAYNAANETPETSGSLLIDGEEAWLCVAKIGNSRYQTLQAAVNAAVEGDTITILAGTVSEGTVKLPATLKNVTLKGAEGAILKNMTIMAADGNAISYEGLTFDGITFENSRISITGWRTGGASVKDLTVTNCTFKNLDDTTNSAPVHINMAETEAVENFTFTNNVIDGAIGGSKSGVYAQTTGKTVFTGNTINNVSFRPYVIQITTDDGIADEFIVTDNTFSGSAAGRAQGLGNNAEGTDTVKLVVSENIFKDITSAQQICYWNFNEETTADLSKNYYDIDILNNPAKIYYNGAAQNAADLIEMGVFPYYADEAKTQLVEAPAIMVTYPVGNPVYPEGKVEYYQNLLDAVPYTTNCPRLEGAIVTLLMDIEAPGIRMMENDMVLDLNGHTYTITTGTGSQGTNTSGFQIRPEVTTVATIKNGTIQVAEGAPVVWMFNNYATNFVVENVIVDCANMAYSYGESCYVHVSRAGDNTQFTGNTQIINFNSEVAGDAINVGGTMTMEETVVPGGSFVLDVGATLTAPANLDVTALEGYKVAYENGVYSLVEITYVAQIGNTKYETFEEALDAAKAAGMTEVEVTLLADCKFSTKVKNFTKVTVKGTDRAQTLDLNLNAVVELGNVELVFEDLTVSRLDKEWLYHWFYAGKITYRDCKMIGQFNVSAQDTDFIGCDFYNDDSFGDGNYSLWVYNCLEGVEVNVTDCTFDVYERAIKMFGDGYTGNMVLNISGTEFTSRTADKTVVEIAQAQNCSNGSFTLNVTDSTYTGFGAYEHTGNDTENTLFNVEVGSIGGDVKVFKDTVQLWPLNYVAQNVTTGKSYATLQGAIDEAAAGDIITVIADISGETVTVDKSITITGEKRLTDVSITGSNGCELTVSGLTFEGKSWINAGSASELTVSDVTATNVAPANSATTNSRNAFISLGRNEAQKLALVVENSEIYCTNSGDAINGWAQLTSATISGNTFGSESKYNNGNNVIKIMSVAENAQITFAGNTVYANWNGFAVAPNNTRGNAHTIVVENNTFVGGADFIWIETQNATYTYATVKATGNNTINGAAFTAADIKTDENTWYYYGGVNVELDAEGKLIGGTFNAQSNKELVASGYEAVENADGTWTVVPSEKYVAWNLQTQEKYETVAAALTAATSGQTVQMLADSDEATSILLILNGITLDLNGKQLTALYAITTASEAGIIDSANAQGLLKVAKANLSIHDNAQLPVWIEEEAGFRFATVAPRQLAPTTSNGAATYTFYVSRNNTSAIFGKELADGAEDGDGLSVTIKMYYTDRNGQEQMLNFTPPAETLKKYAATWYDESKTLMGITMTVYGIDTISNVSFQTVYAYGATEVASDRISLNAE